MLKEAALLFNGDWAQSGGLVGPRGGDLSALCSRRWEASGLRGCLTPFLSADLTLQRLHVPRAKAQPPRRLEGSSELRHISEQRRFPFVAYRFLFLPPHRTH